MEGGVDTRDTYHGAAADYFEKLLDERCSFVTSDGVFGEVITLLKYRSGLDERKLTKVLTFDRHFAQYGMDVFP